MKKMHRDEKNSGCSYLYPEWQVPNHIGAVFTTRLGGVSQEPFDSFNLALHVSDDESDVAANRNKLNQEQALESVMWLDQVHGIDVVETINQQDSVPIADGSYTHKKGIACAVMVADCMPVLVTDKTGSCVGVAHAGWRGLCHGIVPNLLDKMQINPADAIVWLGPCIGDSAFEVGSDVLNAYKTSPSFTGVDVSAAFVEGQGGRFLANLPGLAKMQLADMGVKNVYSADQCTYGDSGRYFSYRREGLTGRMAALIWINNQ